MAFLVGQDRQIAYREVRVGRGRGEQTDQAVGHRPHGLGLEQVGGVLDRAVQTVRTAVLGVLLGEEEGQVEFGCVRADVLADHLETGHAEVSARGVRERQHHLEQRVVGERPGRVEHLDQSLERHVLVGVRGQVGGADAVEQLGEGGVARHVGAQHQGVDEEPDEVVERLVGPSGDRRAHGDVGPRPHTGQQGGDTGLDHHEQARLVGPGQRLERLVDDGGHVKLHDTTAVPGDRGAWAVGGQLQQLRGVGQRRPPVGELAADQAVRVLLTGEEFVLPQGEVRVLHAQCRPGGAPAGAPGRVRGGEIARERGRGPAVARDVVQ